MYLWPYRSLNALTIITKKQNVSVKVYFFTFSFVAHVASSSLWIENNFRQENRLMDISLLCTQRHLWKEAILVRAIFGKKGTSLKWKRCLGSYDETSMFVSPSAEIASDVSMPRDCEVRTTHQTTFQRNNCLINQLTRFKSEIDVRICHLSNTRNTLSK